MPDSVKGSAKDKAVLAVDIGSLNTRSLLFEINDGRYQFISSGSSPSTFDAPHRNVNEGVYQSLVDLQKSSGRLLLDDDARLITPQNEAGMGIDRLVLTCSAGPDIRVVLIGLVNNLDMANAEKALNYMRTTIVEKIGLNDDRPLDRQVDAIINAAPDLIFLTGGTEGGALRSVAKQAELVLLVCRLLPEEKRPLVIYAGNTRIAQKTAETLQRWTRVYVADNIYPIPGQAVIESAVESLADAVMEIRKRQLPGLEPLAGASQASPLPVAHAYGRTIRYLGKINNPEQDLAGIAIGASTTLLALSNQGDLIQQSFPYGSGRMYPLLEEKYSLQAVYKWLAADVSLEDVGDYLHQKSVYPGLVPMHDEALAIEHSLARLILSKIAGTIYPRDSSKKRAVDPVIVSGRCLTQSPDASTSMLTLLNGLQPIGISNFLFDSHDLLAPLGVIAQINSILPVQVLDGRLMTASGPVIGFASKAKHGSDIAFFSLEFKDGKKQSFPIKQGSLVRLPVQNGQNVRLYMEISGKAGALPGLKQKQVELDVTGGLFGIIVDARSKPLTISDKPAQRLEQLTAWKQALNTPAAEPGRKE